MTTKLFFEDCFDNKGRNIKFSDGKLKATFADAYEKANNHFKAVFDLDSDSFLTNLMDIFSDKITKEDGTEIREVCLKTPLPFTEFIFYICWKKGANDATALHNISLIYGREMASQIFTYLGEDPSVLSHMEYKFFTEKEIKAMEKW